MKILIIEDDFTSSRVLERMLQKYGISDIANNGNLGIQMFRTAFEAKEPYDLVCLDIMLPEIDGQEVLKEIRQIESDNNIFGSESVKVIMTTALDDNRNIMQAFRSQCEGYLVKPIIQAKLHQEVARLCNTTSK
jgi:two-component system chemotaxis response regulator CheY